MPVTERGECVLEQGWSFPGAVKVKLFSYGPRVGPRSPIGWGSQISRQSAHEGGKVVNPRHRLPLPLRKYSWYSFLLVTESTPGPYYGRKDNLNEKLQWQHRNRNRDLPACSAVSQTNAPLNATNCSISNCSYFTVYKLTLTHSLP